MFYYKLREETSIIDISGLRPTHSTIGSQRTSNQSNDVSSSPFETENSFISSKNTRMEQLANF